MLEPLTAEEREYLLKWANRYQDRSVVRRLLAERASLAAALDQTAGLRAADNVELERVRKAYCELEAQLVEARGIARRLAHELRASAPAADGDAALDAFDARNWPDPTPDE